MTKKQLRAYADTYLCSAKEHRLQDIHAAYSRPSEDKEHIFNRLVNEADMFFLRHTPVAVMVHNCQLFTVGYCYIATVDVDTAYFVYKTAKNGYLLKLEDDETKTVLKLCM